MSIAMSSAARPNQCKSAMPLWAISQPPLPAPSAWPAYIAEVLSAIDAEDSAGAMPARRACCAELLEKQPSPQGTLISAASSRLLPRGHSNRLNAMLPTPHITERAAPRRSIWRDITTLPITPKAPNHANNRLNCPGVMSSTAL